MNQQGTSKDHHTGSFAKTDGPHRVARWRGRRAKRDQEKPLKITASRVSRSPFLRPVVLWTAGVTLLAAGLIFLFFYSSALVVNQVRVEGVSDEVADSVLERAAIPHGRPLARISTERVRERVLEDLRVADVTIDRDWPSSVTLVAAPREPALVLRQGDVRYHADADGVVYEETSSPAKDVPVVRTQEDPADLDRSVVRGLVQMWELRLDEERLRGDLGSLTLRRHGEVRFDIEQVRVLWGTPDQAEKKWAVIGALLAQETIDPRGALPLTVDVRTPDTPVVTGLPAASNG